jgi:NADH:ubiquinone reductase (non-electrogenic)
MRSIKDVQKLRNKVMDCFETAVIPGQPEEEQHRLLRFLVVGGGPAGVEYAAGTF